MSLFFMSCGGGKDTSSNTGAIVTSSPPAQDESMPSPTSIALRSDALEIDINACSGPYFLETQDDDNHPLAVLQDTQVFPEDAYNTVFYKHEGCLEEDLVSDFLLSQGTSETSFYLKNTKAGKFILKVRSTLSLKNPLELNILSSEKDQEDSSESEFQPEQQPELKEASKLFIASDTSISAGVCMPLHIVAQDEEGKETAVSEDLEISFNESKLKDGKLYATEENCTKKIASTLNSQILNGASQSNILFFKNEKAQTSHIEASSIGFMETEQEIQVQPAAPSWIELSTVSLEFEHKICTPFHLTTKDPFHNEAKVLNNKTFQISASGMPQVPGDPEIPFDIYTDAQCTDKNSNLTFVQNQDSKKAFYLKPNLPSSLNVNMTLAAKDKDTVFLDAKLNLSVIHPKPHHLELAKAKPEDGIEEEMELFAGQCVGYVLRVKDRENQTIDFLENNDVTVEVPQDSAAKLYNDGCMVFLQENSPQKFSDFLNEKYFVFFVKDEKAEKFLLTARYQDLSTSLSLDIPAHPEIDQIIFSKGPNSISAGDRVAYTLEAQDKFGNPKTANDTTYFQLDATDGEFSNANNDTLQRNTSLKVPEGISQHVIYFKDLKSGLKTLKVRYCAVEKCNPIWSEKEIQVTSTIQEEEEEISSQGLITQVEAGETHTCAIRDKKVLCWGNNAFGQLGSESSGKFDKRARHEEVPEIDSATAISLGRNHSCALLEDKTVKCWGQNNNGQLGNGLTVSSFTPVWVQDLENVKAIAAGGYHTCALLEEGTVKCWGSNSSLQLAYATRPGDISSSYTPVTISGLENGVSISAGIFHTCVVLPTGFVQCWGMNNKNQLGSGNTTGHTAPVYAQIGDVQSLALNENHTCATLTDGKAKCWGSNANGQLGQNTQLSGYPSYQKLASPAFVQDRNGNDLENVKSMAVGAAHSCALFKDGTIKCWGQGSFAQLGFGQSPASHPYPNEPVQGIINAVSISAGGHHTCALLEDERIACWGSNYDGQLGKENWVGIFNTPHFIDLR
ncbi:MAG: hypothetical protein A3B70_07430 [Deltaproteobacteria bacterium RIFCSPHIGHO2_02_FULL_40_11]|nr:MAG: hypothetical protein A3B70_07430 [Deltaproteobacteria bacterium RIFCSPHIGHO2_02_FULL_40_11]